MDGFREIQKITLRNLTLRMHLRKLDDKIKCKEEDYDKLDSRTLDALINNYNSIIKEFDEENDAFHKKMTEKLETVNVVDEKCVLF